METERNFKTVQTCFNKGFGIQFAGKVFAWNAQGLEFDPHNHKMNKILAKKKTKK